MVFEQAPTLQIQCLGIKQTPRESRLLLTSSPRGWHARSAGAQMKEALLMKCHRCHGLMVVDYFIDIANSGHLWLCGWRCVSCGDVLDPEIMQHRQIQRARLAQMARSLTRKTRKTFDLERLSA